MNNSKKILMFLFGFVLLVAAVASVDAALCRGFDGYYHDCGYSYGHNSYGSSYGSGHGSSSYGKQSYGYSGHYRNDKVVYLNKNYKKYNTINDYYIYSGPGYQRTYKDYDYDRSYRKHNVRYVKDERHYEYRSQVDPDAKRFKVYIVGAEDRHHGYDNNVIRLGDGSWDDGDPYHAVKNHQKVRKLHFEGEEHCPDGFVCVTGSWY